MSRKNQILLFCLAGAVLPASVFANAESSFSSWQSIGGGQKLVVGSSLPTKDTQPDEPSKKTDVDLSHLKTKPKVIFNGFLSAGFVKTTADDNVDYVLPEGQRISNEADFISPSRAGAQVAAKLNSWADVVSQFVAARTYSDSKPRFTVQTNMAFFRLKRETGPQVRVGRFPVPLFFYSSTSFVAYTYPWQFLPTEVYSSTPFSRMNGVDVAWSHTSSAANWNTSLQGFFGENTNQYQHKLDNEIALTEKNIVGGVFSTGNQHFTLRGSYTRYDLSSDTGIDAKSSSIWSAGVKVTGKHFFAMSEFSKSKLSTDALNSIEGVYVTAGMRLGQFMPSLTLASVKSTGKQVAGAESPVNQMSVTLATDYYVNQNLLTKLTGSVIKPRDKTSGLFSGGDQSKTTYMVGAELDAIF